MSMATVLATAVFPLFTQVVRAYSWQFGPAITPAVIELLSLNLLANLLLVYLSSTDPLHTLLYFEQSAKRRLESKPLDTRHETRYFTAQCPDFYEIRKITREIFNIVGLSYPERELARAGEPIVPSVPKIGVWELPSNEQEQLWQLNTKKGALQKKLLDEWQKLGIDFILAPAGPHIVVTPGGWTPYIYTIVWNAMDVSSSKIPLKHRGMYQLTKLVVPGNHRPIRKSGSEVRSQEYKIQAYA